MATTIGVAEAKRRFSELIDRVRAGEHFVVTRRGKPVIALLPPAEVDLMAHTQGEPLGLAAFVGILETVEGIAEIDVDEMLAEIYADRLRAMPRDLPDRWLV